MRADRLLAILLRLHSRGTLTTQKLATELEVSRRTILRDVAALSMAGIPVYAEGGHGGGVHLDPAYRVNLTGLTEPEATALARAFKQLPNKGPQHQQAANLGFLKLLAALPAQQRHAVQMVQQRVHLDPTAWWQVPTASPSLEAIEHAIFTERQLLINYERHDGTLTERVIEPYGLVDKASTWYLVAQSKREWRTYRVDRIRAVVILDTDFVRQDGFDLAAHWQAQSEAFERDFPLFDCCFSVAPEGMIKLNRYAAGRFQVEELPSFALWQRISLRLTSIEEACMLIWGLGEHVRIISPPALLDAVATLARKTLGMVEASASLLESSIAHSQRAVSERGDLGGMSDDDERLAVRPVQFRQ
jgi:predicted DNA-binding transcriptional regulator YafY